MNALTFATAGGLRSLNRILRGVASVEPPKSGLPQCVSPVGSGMPCTDSSCFAFVFVHVLEKALAFHFLLLLSLFPASIFSLHIYLR